MNGEAAFWSTYQPGFRFSSATPGTREFFAEVEKHRYELEPHIPEIVGFDRWRDADVLEVGCGIATDGLQFARAGARYTGLDFTPQAIALAQRRFELEGSKGSFVAGSADRLPFEDEHFDLVYSHGVIHHIEQTAQAVREFHRVLRPGGTALVMVYHRRSFNYLFTIMTFRRLLAALLLVPGGPAVASRLSGERRDVLDAHRDLLRVRGLRYLLDRRLFLSNNTDGPGNPLSKVYSRAEISELFSDFDRLETAVRFLNLRIYPGGAALARTRIARAVEQRIGWHLYVKAEKLRES